MALTIGMNPTPFTIDNIPFGVISTAENPEPRCASAYEGNAIDLSVLEKDGFFVAVAGFKEAIFASETLNAFASLPQVSRSEVREKIIKLLKESSTVLETRGLLIPLAEVINHFPMRTTNFSDFTSSLEHVRNGMELSNIKAIPLNWLSSPMVYNGRTSSLVVSGTPIKRPYGVFSKVGSTALPSFQPSNAMDFELEMGVFLSKPVPFGQRLEMTDVKDHIFGFVILNDWSARDIQGFEMPPLGPFHGKGMGTTISPWIVTMDALEAAKSVREELQDPAPLPHLSWNGSPADETFDIELTASIKRDKKSTLVTSTNLKTLHWTPYQQLTHLGSAGEGLSVGDIFGTGTVSCSRVDPQNEKIGIACLFERMVPHNQLSSLKDESLVYLRDGDEVVMEGWCRNQEGKVLFGFGDCRGVIVPASLPEKQ